MKFLLIILTFLIISCKGSDKEPEIPGENSKILAFPGAEGGGAYATGGNTGSVYFVTSLKDDVTLPGTLRYILNLPGNKMILFKVAGIIELNAPLRIKTGNITIAGQSAPGDGICIKNYPVIIEADNVIMRFLRFRMGDQKQVEGDALTCIGRKNIIIDHCTMSWGTDECASAYDNTNFTMQWCIISESLRNSIHGKGSHGYAGIWGGKTVSFHHNLLAHHDSRNPRFCGSRYSSDAGSEKVDFRNNIIYNWSMNSGYAGEGGSYNIVNNYYKPGPATYGRKASETRLYRIFQPNSDDGTNKQGKGIWGKFYVAGNYVEGYEDVTADNWTKGIQPNIKDYDKDFTKDQIKSTVQFEIARYTRTQTAAEAYESILEKAGASLVRDEVDERVAAEVRDKRYTYTGSNGSRYGIIDSQEDAGGWPLYSAYDIKKDSDNDGMPDDWETEHGLNPNNMLDASAYTLDKNYTNLEVYLNSLVDHLY